MTINNYTPGFLASVERTISKERLTRYLAATKQDMDAALTLYEHNVEISEALFGFLHGLEVAVRNSIHYTLCADLGVSDWYRGGTPLPWSKTHEQLSFTSVMRDMITTAKDKAGSAPTPGKVIAELTFGFWPSLIAKNFNASLWVPCLHKAFPHAGPIKRREIHRRLDTIRWLRNRIAHHEPIATSRNVVRTGSFAQPDIALAEILECVEWVSTDAAIWLKTQSRYRQAEALLAAINQMGVSL